ncbi:hypothetical protein FRC14_001392 [Serendipita sp. 396]|nr:hypothetical protein FRC14_001392 [Serendipita sp. 396]KAG8774784.1 hypothetical protein FRC15_001058 [Serendipita sp. 397]KAG8790607.1 hypothetical protein FRC16_000801 [Serendipita sp. 398]KAG8824053.1 hypothetical protein FRC19_002676 [Serendipita sp. 401]KAG8832605.1 hypothetical protein FRC18_004807 [Serendipita sp. 400]KAG8849871.1 hypothetical protein FRB91_009552 [Serendipita sp. 411]KAG8852421.1 hypothetical protein FRC20_001515 [Serendipita sp. 405]KAG9055381.1 hypothetical prot
MSSVTSAIENLFHSIWQILSGLVGSFAAVGQSIFALAQNLIQAVFAIVTSLVTAITDLMSGLVGFVLGNIFIILAIGAGYWFWATQTASGKRKTAGGTKTPLK